MKKKVKGFTLVELIIVIAIIGILSAILIPSWMNYIAKARTKTQNNNSRVVFSAAQTAVIQQQFRERRLDPTKHSIGTGDFYFYWDGEDAEVQNDDGTAIGTQDETFNDRFSSSINKVFSSSDEASYRIYVNNYIVQSVVCARSESDRYLGSYPTKREEATNERILSFEMVNADLDTSNDV